MAVIAAEDQQFPFHTGFDFKSIREAVRHNARSRRVRGASTISQQVAKNLFLWSGRSYVRKGLEAGFTVLIEWLWPKERILEVYLNIAEFGRGIYGVEAAAQRYFHKPARRLRRADAALLAAVLLRARAPGVDHGADGRPRGHGLPGRARARRTLNPTAHRAVEWIIVKFPNRRGHGSSAATRDRLGRVRRATRRHRSRHGGSTPSRKRRRRHQAAGGIWIKDSHNRWYYGRFTAPCTGLPFAATVRFKTGPSGELDRRGFVRARDADNCAFMSLVRSDGPPQKADRKPKAKAAEPAISAPASPAPASPFKPPPTG
jgi:hypothetical protein